MTIPIRSERAIRSCWQCIHYDPVDTCRFEPAHAIWDARSDAWSERVEDLPRRDQSNFKLYEMVNEVVNAEVPCRHHIKVKEQIEMEEKLP